MHWKENFHYKVFAISNHQALDNKWKPTFALCDFEPTEKVNDYATFPIIKCMHLSFKVYDKIAMIKSKAIFVAHVF